MNPSRAFSHQKLGVLALWHEVVERNSVRQSTVDMIKKYMPDEFNHLIQQPMPLHSARPNNGQKGK